MLKQRPQERPVHKRLIASSSVVESTIQADDRRQVSLAPRNLGRIMTPAQVPMVERSKTLDFESELEIAQSQIMSTIITIIISTIDLVLYRLFHLFRLIISSHRPMANEDG
ncbi:hypothetical protein J6590_105540 [Homalodisca vitripennis]|nr:hypothetical protein J6590_105540 [Homalodisca vitripennis]